MSDEAIFRTRLCVGFVCAVLGAVGGAAVTRMFNPHVSAYWFWFALVFGIGLLVPAEKCLKPTYVFGLRVIPVASVYLDQNPGWVVLFLVHLGISVVGAWVLHRSGLASLVRRFLERDASSEAHPR